MLLVEVDPRCLLVLSIDNYVLKLDTPSGVARQNGPTRLSILMDEQLLEDPHLRSRYPGFRVTSMELLQDIMQEAVARWSSQS